MKLRLLAAASAVFGLITAASAANAAITVALPNSLNQLYTATGQTILWDFDGIANSNTSYTGNVHAAFTGTVPNISDSAPPPLDGGVTVCCGPSGNFEADPTKYASVQDEDGDPGAVFKTLNNTYLTSFSFYMGSPDSYNKVVFHLLGGGSPQVFQGDDIWGGSDVQVGNGDRSKGFRVYYDFGGAKVTQIDFTSTTDAFEFDGLAGSLGGVPDPASWALMIMGFGAAGAMIRRRRVTA